MNPRQSLIAALVVFGAKAAVAQGMVSGSWVVAARDCFPSGPRCTGPNAEMGSWTLKLDLNVRGDTLLLAAAPRAALPQAPGHVDTLLVDGKTLRWLPGRTGIARVPGAPMPSQTRSADQPVTRIPWVGETWKLSADGSTLVHDYRGPDRGDSTFYATWTYKRASR